MVVVWFSWNFFGFSRSFVVLMEIDVFYYCFFDAFFFFDVFEEFFRTKI